MAYKPTGRAEGPAHGPEGSVGTDRFGSESAPTSKWNSTVPQKSAGEGDYPYPDAHSTVPTADADKGDYFPYPDAHSSVPSGDAGAGDYPTPQERSTVGPQNAGAGASGPRQEYPADTTSAATQDYNGGDGGDYRWGIPYSQAMPQTKEWGVYGPSDGGYGHSDEVKETNFQHNWGSKVSEEKGYEVLGQERDGGCPAVPGGTQYPEPKSDPWDCDPQTVVLKR